MNRILYPISKTLLAVVLLLGITGKSFAQMQSYFTATIKSAISQMALSGKTVYVSHVANSPANQYTQAAITNQQGVANFQLPYYGSSGSNVWNVYVVHQGDTMPVDSIYFPSAGYQIGKTLINAVQSAINAGNFTVVGNDMRFGMGSNQASPRTWSPTISATRCSSPT